MVPNSPENAFELFLADSSTLQPVLEPNRTGVNPTASCVAYLQKKFNNSSLSEEAARLLLASEGPSQTNSMTHSMTHTPDNRLSGAEQFKSCFRRHS